MERQTRVGDAEVCLPGGLDGRGRDPFRPGDTFSAGDTLLPRMKAYYDAAATRS